MVRSCSASPAATRIFGRLWKSGSCGFTRWHIPQFSSKTVLPSVTASSPRLKSVDRVQIRGQRAAAPESVPRERRHSAVMHEIQSAQHGMNLAGPTAAMSDSRFEPTIGVGGVAALALHAEDLAPHRDLVIRWSDSGSLIRLADWRMPAAVTSSALKPASPGNLRRI